jgi:hypothetical protein
MSRKLLIYGLLLLLLNSCGKPGMNWNVSLSSEDKAPYGGYLAFTSLKHFFPGTEIDVLSPGFKYNNIDQKMTYGEGRSLLILTGLRFNLSDQELEKLISFTAAGNEVILFCSSLDARLGDRLKCQKQSVSFYGYGEDQPLRSKSQALLNENVLALSADTNIKYGYSGRIIWAPFELTEEDSSVPEKDTAAEDIYENLLNDTGEEDADTDTFTASEDVSISETEDAEQDPEAEAAGEEYEDYINTKPEILGYASGNANFVRYEVGEGHITLHAAPLVMSNYFLLQDNNIDYLAGIWNTLPEDVSNIYWNSYLNRSAEDSSFAILWKNPPTRWALWLSIITLSLYVLLEVKRRQKPIPIVKAPENTSVSFVETVGRLYYNKGNHRNLAEKMVQHFLEHVRLNYYMNTSQVNDVFAQQLARKSGLPPEICTHLVEMIHEVRLGQTKIDEAYLYHLNNTIQRFHKKTG